MMKVYPVFLNLDNRPCLVVGGGGVGQRKVEDLLAAGARVTVVSREATPALQALAAQGAITFFQEDFQPEHLDGMALVIAATNDHETNTRVSLTARAQGLPVNVVDQPHLCTFVVPATIRRGDLTIAVGTGGSSPALAKKLRRELEQAYGPEYGPYLELLGAIRAKVLSCRRDHPDNMNLFTRIVASPFLELLADQDQEGLTDLLKQLLAPVLSDDDLRGLQALAAGLCQKTLPPEAETRI